MKLLAKKKIGFVGCGNMGGAIIEAMVAQNFILPENIYVFDALKTKVTKCVKKHKVSSVASFKNLLEVSDIIILAVKPQNIDSLLEPDFKKLYKNKLLISILAGTTLAKLAKLTGSNVKIIRCMPNLGVLVNHGVSALCKNRCATLRDLFLAQKIFSCCGSTVTVAEKYFDTVTAISGSGPAYYFYLTELLIAEGVTRGLKRSDATLLAQETAHAASVLMTQGTASAEEWRKKVTSPGGTTEAALSVMLSSTYKKLFSSAIKKAIKRGAELSK